MFAIVKVFPDPVTPNKVWYFSPLLIPLDKKFIAYIYFWILREDIFLTLLRFDSYTLFNLLLYLFTERDITKIIKNFDFSTINADSLDELKSNIKEVLELCLTEISTEEKKNFPVFEGVSQVEIALWAN